MLINLTDEQQQEKKAHYDLLCKLITDKSSDGELTIDLLPIIDALISQAASLIAMVGFTHGDSRNLSASMATKLVMEAAVIEKSAKEDDDGGGYVRLEKTLQ